MYSWLRRSLTGINNQETQKSKTSKNVVIQFEDEDYYGVTHHLIEFIKTFTFDTFKDFPLPEEQSDGIQTSLSGISVDLSEWQQQHAILILSKVKVNASELSLPSPSYVELSQLRYMLCPRHLKERQFWRIYFTLVKSHLTEYELRAIRLDKLRKMAAEDDTVASDTNGIELEMTEPKHTMKSTSP